MQLLYPTHQSHLGRLVGGVAIAYLASSFGLYFGTLIDDSTSSDGNFLTVDAIQQVYTITHSLFVPIRH